VDLEYFEVKKMLKILRFYRPQVGFIKKCVIFLENTPKKGVFLLKKRKL